MPLYVSPAEIDDSRPDMDLDRFEAAAAVDAPLCKSGLHELTPANTFHLPSGAPRCRACRRAQQRASELRRKSGEPRRRAGRTAEPPVERFWRFVDQAGECWVWTGGKTPKGYGCFGWGPRGSITEAAHRYSWTIANGPIPDGMMVRHKCDNRICVRPEHLELGTHADNMRDMIERNRSASGERQGHSKLTWAEVRNIRARVARGEPNAILAHVYGVTPSCIRAIAAGTNWRDDPEANVPNAIDDDASHAEEERRRTQTLHDMCGPDRAWA